MTIPYLINDLQPMTASDYEAAIARYVESCRKMRGIRAIYQFGSVGAPGLSDVDIIVVVSMDDSLGRDGLAEASIQHERWERDDVVRRCFIHDVLVCGADEFQSLDWLVVGSKLTLLAGTPIEREQPSGSERALVEVVQGLDFSLARLHEFSRLEAESQLSMRWLIPQLWSIIHTKGILQRAGIELDASWVTLADALTALRSQPVLAMSPGLISDLWPEVRYHFANAAGRLIAWLVTQGWLPGEGTRRRVSIAGSSQRMINVYYPKSPGEDRGGFRGLLLRKQIRLGHRGITADWSRVDLPAALLCHHLGYWRASPRHRAMAERVARQAHVNWTSDAGMYSDIIKRRMRIVESNDARLHAARIGFGRIMIPGLPMEPAAASGRECTRSLRYRAVKSLLDWHLLPSGTIGTRTTAT